MSTYELQQWLGLAAGGGVAVAVLVGLVRMVRRMNALWPNAAARFGLTLTSTNEGSVMTGPKYVTRLSGPTLNVLSVIEHVGRTRRTSTAITALAPAAPRGVIFTISRQRPASALHLVPTGDATFDRLRFITSDAGEAVARLMSPAAREAAQRCPQHELRVHCDGGAVVVSFGPTPLDVDAVERPIELALALAGAAA